MRFFWRRQKANTYTKKNSGKLIWLVRNSELVFRDNMWWTAKILRTYDRESGPPRTAILVPAASMLYTFFKEAGTGTENSKVPFEFSKHCTAPFSRSATQIRFLDSTSAKAWGTRKLYTVGFHLGWFGICLAPNDMILWTLWLHRCVVSCSPYLIKLSQPIIKNNFNIWGCKTIQGQNIMGYNKHLLSQKVGQTNGQNAYFSTTVG